ncbi:hypothetical protein ACET3Z_011121 [Daucus carota]
MYVEYQVHQGASKSSLQCTCEQGSFTEKERSHNQEANSQLHSELQENQIPDIQDQCIPIIQSPQSSNRDHILHLDQWEINPWDLRDVVDNSSSDSDKKLDGLFSASMDKAYDLADMEEARGEEVYFLGHNSHLDNKLLVKMSQVNLGKKVGRPRKRVELRNVFDIKGFKIGRRKKVSTQSKKLATGKKKGPKGNKENIQEHSTKPVGMLLLEKGEDIASQILETAELMGLVLQEDKQQAYEKIQQVVLES